MVMVVVMVVVLGGGGGLECKGYKATARMWVRISLWNWAFSLSMIYNSETSLLSCLIGCCCQR